MSDHEIRSSDELRGVFCGVGDIPNQNAPDRDGPSDEHVGSLGRLLTEISEQTPGIVKDIMAQSHIDMYRNLTREEQEEAEKKREEMIDDALNESKDMPKSVAARALLNDSLRVGTTCAVPWMER